MTDLYEVLQVHPAAEPDVIRAAYRTLARKYHPDHGGDPSRMIALNDAWDVLGDPARRAVYDRSRIDQARPAPAQAAASGPLTQRPPDVSPQRQPAGSTATRPAEEPRAGPPPGRPSGSVLDFGRYAGWSLGEIARYDVDYLEWLQRATFGRRLRAEIDALLRQRAAASGHGSPTQDRGRRR